MIHRHNWWLWSPNGYELDGWKDHCLFEYCMECGKIRVRRD